MSARWFPGAFDEGQLMLHDGKRRRPIDCTRDQLGRIHDAFEAGGREPMTMEQIKGAIEGERAHSHVGASGFSRWSVCPGSVALGASLPNKDSDYSTEGTAAHWVGEQAFSKGQDAWEYAGQKAPNGVEVDEEMVEGVQLWLDTINADLAAYEAEGHDDAKLFVEHRFSLAQLGVEDAFGTADMAIYFPAWRLLRVYDFKYGAGIVVEVEGNGQVRYYSTGVLLDLPALIGHGADVAEIETVIVQPRCEHPDGYVRRERLTVDELNAWVESDLLPAIARTREPGAAIVEGPHCRFCPVKAALVCPVLDQLHKQLAEIPDATKEAAALDDWELAERVARIGPVKMYIKALEEEAFARMRRGVVIPGYKLVNKKANRVLKEKREIDGQEVTVEAAAKEKWGALAYTMPALKSPAQLEKLEGGKPFVTEWAYTPDAGLTLAPDTDKRAAVKARTAKEIFAGVIEGGKA